MAKIIQFLKNIHIIIHTLGCICFKKQIFFDKLLIKMCLLQEKRKNFDKTKHIIQVLSNLYK